MCSSDDHADCRAPPRWYIRGVTNLSRRIALRSSRLGSLCVILLASTSGALALEAQAAPSRPALSSTVFPPDSGRVRATSTGRVRAIVDTPTTTLAKLEMHETTLAPGQSPHAPHRHVDEELLVIRTGTLEVLQGDVTRPARAGSVIFHASNELHGMRNVGPDTARYLVIRVAPRGLDAPPATSAPRSPPR
jgi:quercetin dioxygenase-like cupin family protein